MCWCCPWSVVCQGCGNHLCAWHQWIPWRESSNYHLHHIWYKWPLQWRLKLGWWLHHQQCDILKASVQGRIIIRTSNNVYVSTILWLTTVPLILMLLCVWMSKAYIYSFPLYGVRSSFKAGHVLSIYCGSIYGCRFHVLVRQTYSSCPQLSCMHYARLCLFYLLDSQESYIVDFHVFCLSAVWWHQVYHVHLSSSFPHWI